MRLDVTGADGEATFLYTPSAATALRVTFAPPAGQPAARTYLAARSTNETVTPHAALTTPRVPAVIDAADLVTAAGDLLPHHPAGGHSVELVFQRRGDGGDWVTQLTVAAVNRDVAGSDATRFVGPRAPHPGLLARAGGPSRRRRARPLHELLALVRRRVKLPWAVAHRAQVCGTSRAAAHVSAHEIRVLPVRLCSRTGTSANLTRRPHRGFLSDLGGGRKACSDRQLHRARFWRMRAGAPRRCAPGPRSRRGVMTAGDDGRRGSVPPAVISLRRRSSLSRPFGRCYSGPAEPVRSSPGESRVRVLRRGRTPKGQGAKDAPKLSGQRNAAGRAPG